MDSKVVGYGARAAGAFVAYRYGSRFVPGVHPLLLAVGGWLVAGLVLDAAIPGKGQ